MIALKQGCALGRIRNNAKGCLIRTEIRNISGKVCSFSTPDAVSALLPLANQMLFVAFFIVTNLVNDIVSSSIMFNSCS